ncbi:MAG: hypothetical protein ACP5NW_04035 [Candidatus Woesearchaeota archaeon]
MKRETMLDKDREDFLYKAIERFDVGNCIHDKFLGILCRKMSCCSYGIMSPKLIYPLDKYNFVENYRQIIDKDNIDKIVYAYFDHPLMESKLYLSTFDDGVKRQLLGAIREISYDFRSTPYNQLPITIKISMSPFCDVSDLKIMDWDKQTLRYFDQPVISPEKIFDVVDMEGLDKEFLEMMK